MTTKKTVLTYGLASGAVTSTLMLAANSLLASKRLATSDFIGYSSIVLMGLIVFFGIRSYRQNVGEGRMTFLQGFGVGVGITLISCTLYLATFQLLFYELRPGIEETYAECMIERARRSGASDAEIIETTKQARRIVGLLRNPWSNIALTLLEPLPMGLVLTTVSAAILRKR